MKGEEKDVGEEDRRKLEEDETEDPDWELRSQIEMRIRMNMKMLITTLNIES